MSRIIIRMGDQWNTVDLLLEGIVADSIPNYNKVSKTG